MRLKRLFKSTLALTAVCFHLLACQSEATKPSTKHTDLPSGNGYAMVLGDNKAAIASVNPLATKAGLEALAAGGNAIDAALAVAFTLGVVDSHNSGIGGGCFILARLASGEVVAIDGREMAPAAAHRDMYIKDGELQRDLSKTGPLAVGIPGSVQALFELQRKAGNLEFADVLLPAAQLAEKGFAVDKTLASRLGRTAKTIAQFPATAQIFLPGGEALQAGDTLVQRDLAASYRQLATHGPNWFYKGGFASKAAQWMKSNGGIITEGDFNNYHTVWREPVKSEYKGYQIYGFPPPSSGGVHVAQMLNMLAEYDLSELSEADYYHLVAEVMRRAFADRAYWLGDADFTPVPKNLIAPVYAQSLVKSIDLDKASSGIEHGIPPNADTELFDKHTTHLATADAQGNWVAITTTVNTSFGSKVVIPGTGIVLNNQMDDFSAQPGVPNAFGLVGAEANSIEAGKRPLSSMSPTVVTRGGQPVLSIGAAGGPTIISQVLQGLVRKLGLNQPIDAAVAAPRIHHQWQPQKLFIERALAADVREALESKGHGLQEMGSFGGTQAIWLENGVFTPVTEPRIIERNRPENPEN